MKRTRNLQEVPIAHLYLIGPGGVGKTTVGPLIARRLGWPSIDLDEEFCRNIENIGDYIRQKGYESYVIANSQLFTRLLSEQSTPSVLALSSGFLSTNILPKIINSNRALAKQTGTSVLILPNPDTDDAAQIILARQMTRGFGLNPEAEAAKYLSRVHEYQELADHQIISNKSPEAIAQEIYQLIFPNLKSI